MNRDLASWRGCPRPAFRPIEGRYVVLEPMDPARHGDDLFEAGASDPADWAFSADGPFATREAFQGWMEGKSGLSDPMFFAIVDRASGRAEGRLAFMRIDAGNGVIETGSILYGPRLKRTRGATEAIFLQARHVFEDLGYRRFEWKCDARNAPSRRAAARLGFAYEGTFAQHMVVKGENRDTAWFSMLDRDWPARKAAFEAWLDEGNFDAAGRERVKLGAVG
ncbi:GNAT family N-acetyltransferase [Salinarimonas sp.]|uniref:GNAT family N-acetyltransferase n=1 Tax=Salinarimonas sp. TaxID=2766526 RepID=UPI00391C90A6